MNTECSVCGESFVREPGFYFGAMYMSYALYVSVVAVGFLWLILWLHFPPLFVLAGLIAVIVLLQPAFFRLGRLLWIGLFVSYKPKVGS